MSQNYPSKIVSFNFHGLKTAPGKARFLREVILTSFKVHNFKSFRSYILLQEDEHICQVLVMEN